MRFNYKKYRSIIFSALAVISSAIMIKYAMSEIDSAVYVSMTQSDADSRVIVLDSGHGGYGLGRVG